MQVLSKALEVWGLACPSLDAPERRAQRQNPELAEAFICNLQVQFPGTLSDPAEARPEG